MTQLVLTAIGDDRPGLVSALARAVANEGGNWLESQMGRLGGKFAGIVLVDAPEDRLDSLVAGVQALSAEHLLDVSVTRADGTPIVSGTRLALHLLGHDSPGIVREVSSVLASKGVTIDELSTCTMHAPMGDGVLFEADAVVRLPETLSANELQAALESIAAELMVDLDLSQPEATAPSANDSRSPGSRWFG